MLFRSDGGFLNTKLRVAGRFVSIVVSPHRVRRVLATDLKHALLLLEHDGHGVMCDMQNVLNANRPFLPALKSTVQLIGDLVAIQVRIARFSTDQRSLTKNAAFFSPTSSTRCPQLSRLSSCA